MGGVLSRDAAWAIVHLTLLFGCCSATQLISSKHSKHIKEQEVHAYVRTSSSL